MIEGPHHLVSAPINKVVGATEGFLTQMSGGGTLYELSFKAFVNPPQKKNPAPLIILYSTVLVLCDLAPCNTWLILPVSALSFVN